ncbi:MAG: hypothetical protein ACREOY_09770, partial [Candidatus Dormibacteraceae bacterium]
AGLVPVAGRVLRRDPGVFCRVRAVEGGQARRHHEQAGVAGRARVKVSAPKVALLARGPR